MAGREAIYQSMGPGRPLCAPSQQHQQNQNQNQGQDGKSWYSGDASASERQGPWFAKRMGLSVIAILQRQDRQASRFRCRSRLGGIGPAEPPFGASGRGRTAGRQGANK